MLPTDSVKLSSDGNTCTLARTMRYNFINVSIKALIVVTFARQNGMVLIIKLGQ